MKFSAVSKQVSGGFTLIETLMVIALALLIATLAVPSFVLWQVRDQVDSRARTFAATLGFARSEAVRRGVPVTVCRTDQARQCLGVAQPCGGAHDWSCGWAVIAEPAGAQKVLRAQSSELDVRISGVLSDLTFTPPAGQLIGRFRRFEIAPRVASQEMQGPRFQRCIRIAAGGRVRLAEGSCGARP
ncbi:GspH/FimT family pseudopilin [Paraburkholderia bonniea]|uniref:GspH/FimT family pseudopilin n=1 Tax=Paraburkholderia bonniea TaxID=2152891 RepID=UPI0015810B28|nr:GspH/FimT family pseudopilin [Paraburkholderia bonniea]